MSGAREAVVRPYRAGDEVEIQEAFCEVFRVERRAAEWRWKFEQPPRGSRILLAFDERERLLCQYAAIALDVAGFGPERLAGQVVDVLSRARGGLGRSGSPFLRTVEAFLASQRGPGALAFIYGFPGERHQRLGEIGGLYNRTEAIERLTLDLGSPTEPVAPASRRLFEGFSASATDDLWRRAAGRYRAAVVRDARWFAWRYAARPGRDYLQLGISRAGLCRAWTVLALEGAVARWVDLVWDGDDAADLALLAGELEERSRAAGAASLELWIRADPGARDALVARGFVPSVDPERRLSAIVFDPAIALERVLGDLYLTLGDSDHV